MKERAALYARVSTAHQERERTIASQLEALEQAAALRSTDVPSDRRYIDDGFSGSRLDRPALDALRDAAADGLLDLVFIYAPDRLARSYVHQQVVLEELGRRGVRVHFVERPIEDRPEDRLLVQMQGVIAEYERAKIFERTRRGRLHKVRTGQMLPFSFAPYGYAIIKSASSPQGVVVIDEVRAAHVRAMFRWIADEGLSARQAARRLNSLRAPTRQGGPWTGGTVYSVVTNLAYTGQAIYNKREATDPKRPRKPGSYARAGHTSHRLRPESQWLVIPIPAIVDAAMYQRARESLARNVIASPRNTRHEYLLRTLVVCGQCGRKRCCMRQPGPHGGYFYYVCRGRDSIDTGRSATCRARSVRAKELDALVWSALCEWLARPEMLEREVEAWRQRHSGDEQGAREQARLEQALQQLRTQIERLVDAYQHGALTVEELKARRERLEASRDATEERLADARVQRRRGEHFEHLVERLSAFAATLREGLASLDFEGRQRVVRLLIERVVVREDQVTIEHVVPLSGRFSNLRPNHLVGAANAARAPPRTLRAPRRGGTVGARPPAGPPAREGPTWPPRPKRGLERFPGWLRRSEGGGPTV
jgi:site-specific DNA recombinase